MVGDVSSLLVSVSGRGRAMSMVQEVYDRLADEYDGHFLRPVDIAENKLVFDRLNKFKHNMRWVDVLDLGCGTGLYLERCQPLGYVGTDISPGMIARAREKFPDYNLTVMDMASLDFGGETFDIVISTFGSFSYCLRPERAVAEILRVLRLGGRFFVMVYGERYAHRESYIAKDEYLPQIRYTVARLRSVFAGARGLTVFGVSSKRMEWLSGKVSQSALNFLMWAERQTVGRIYPEQCYWLVAEGRK